MSDVGAKIFYEDIPIHKDIKDLSYGDDFELCFTASEQYSSSGQFGYDRTLSHQKLA